MIRSGHVMIAERLCYAVFHASQLRVYIPHGSNTWWEDIKSL